MGGARDAGVVVADRGLAAVRERVVVEVDPLLRRRGAGPPRCSPGFGRWAARSARPRSRRRRRSCSGARWCRGGPRRRRCPRPPWARPAPMAAWPSCPLVDDAQRLLEGVREFHRAHDDRLEGVAARLAQPGLERGLLAARAELVEVEAVARERADKVLLAVEAGVQGVGVLDVELLDVLGDLAPRGTARPTSRRSRCRARAGTSRGGAATRSCSPAPSRGSRRWTPVGPPRGRPRGRAPGRACSASQLGERWACGRSRPP